MRRIEVRLLTAGGEVVLPDWAKVEYNDEFCDVGNVVLSYPSNGLNADAVVDRALGYLLIDGVEPPNARFRIKEGERPTVTDDVVVGVRNAPTMLDDLKGVRVVTHGGQQFSAASPGTIVRTIALAGQTRGCVPLLTFGSFSATTDSNGNAWTQFLTMKYEYGFDLLAMVRDLVNRGVCEVQMVGYDVRLYNRDGLGTDRTLAVDPFVLRKGESIKDASRAETSQDLATTMLVQGDDGFALEVTDATAQATVGERVEGFTSQSGVSDTGALTSIGQGSLDVVKQTRVERTVALGYATGPQPWRDFVNGDWLYVDEGSGLERLRVRQITATADDEGASGAVTLNDKFQELDVRVTRLIEAITGGASGSGTVITGPRPDATTPNPPTGLVLSTSAYLTPEGQTLAQVTAGWAAVTTNTDGSVADDIVGYRYRWKYASSLIWSAMQSVEALTAQISPLLPGVSVEVSVAAVDDSGHVSAWTGSATIVTGADVSGPPTPSTPTLDTLLPKTLRATWNGLGSAGEVMGADFAYIEVHISTTNNFTPSSTTKRDTMRTRGVSPLTGLTPGTTYHVKFVAFDQVGNASAASAQGNGSPLPVKDGDIETLTVSKLTVGTLSADVLVSARIKTADTGVRVEFNAAGMAAFDALGQQTFAVDAATGAVITVGDFATGFSGRRIEISDNAINFRSSNPAVTVPGQIYVLDDGSGTYGQVVLIDSGQAPAPYAGDSSFIILSSGHGFYQGIQLHTDAGNIVLEAADNLVLASSAVGSATSWQAKNPSGMFRFGDPSLYFGAMMALEETGAGNMNLRVASGGTLIRAWDIDGNYVAMHAESFNSHPSTAVNKTSVKTLKGGLEKLDALRPVQYTLKKKRDRPAKPGMLGLIAEEAVAVAPELGSYEEDGELGGVNLVAWLTILTSAVKELAEKGGANG